MYVTSQCTSCSANPTHFIPVQIALYIHTISVEWTGVGVPFAACDGRLVRRPRPCGRNSKEINVGRASPPCQLGLPLKLKKAITATPVGLLALPLKIYPAKHPLRPVRSRGGRGARAKRRRRLTADDWSPLEFDQATWPPLSPAACGDSPPRAANLAGEICYWL